MPDVIFNTELSLLDETVELLYQYVNNIPLSPILSLDPLIYSNAGKGEFSEKSTLLTEIRTRVCEKLDLSDPDVRFFFRRQEAGDRAYQFCIARQITHLFIDRPCGSDLDAEAEAMERAWETLCQKGFHLDVQGSGGLVFLPPREEAKGEGVVEVLCKTDFPAEVKLDLIRAFSDFHTYLSRLLRLVRPAAERLRAELPALRGLLDECAAYWQEHFSRETPAEFEARVMDNQIDPKADTEIRFFLYNCSEVHTMTAGDIDGKNHIFFGCATKNSDRDVTDLKAPLLTARTISSAIRLLGEEKKLIVLREVAKKPCYSLELAEKTETDAGYMSRLLNSLQEAGLITKTRESVRAYYSLNQQTLEYFMDQLRRFILPE